VDPSDPITDVVYDVLDEYKTEIFDLLTRFLCLEYKQAEEHKGPGMDAMAEKFFQYILTSLEDQPKGSEIYDALNRLDTHRMRLELYVQSATEGIAWYWTATPEESTSVQEFN
jgi:hypothetical protein